MRDIFYSILVIIYVRNVKCLITIRNVVNQIHDTEY